MAPAKKTKPPRETKISTTEFILLQHRCECLRDEKTAFFENAPLPMAVIDPEKNIVEANALFRKTFLGLTGEAEKPADESRTSGRKTKNAPEKTPSVSFEKFVSPLYQSTFHHFFRMLQKTAAAPHAEIRMTDAESRDLYIRLTAGTTPLKDRFLITLNDISRVRHLETQLAYARDRVEDGDRKKSLFLTNVSHELRTPLATVSGYAALLQDPLLSAEQRDAYLQSLKNAADTLCDLTNGILSLDNLESARSPLKKTSTDFAALCRETMQLFQRGAESKQVVLSLDAARVPVCKIDAARTRQLVYNLLERAVSSSSSDSSVALRASFVRSDEKHGILILNISGKDIFPPEDDTCPGSSAGSAGLGMYMAGRIVENMGGRIVREHPVDSLSVELPNLEYEESAPPAPSREDETFQPVELPKTCLLVDDVLMNLKVMEAMLRKLHYVPTLATSARDALTLLAHNRFDFIMTDLWMPGMNGEELSMMIRQNAAFNHTPIYAVTADIESSSNFNMEFFHSTIIKPVTVEKLKKLLLSVPVETPAE